MAKKLKLTNFSSAINARRTRRRGRDASVVCATVCPCVLRIAKVSCVCASSRRRFPTSGKEFCFRGQQRSAEHGRFSRGTKNMQVWRRVSRYFGARRKIWRADAALQCSDFTTTSVRRICRGANHSTVRGRLNARFGVNYAQRYITLVALRNIKHDQEVFVVYDL